MTNLELYGTNDVPPIPREHTETRVKMLEEYLQQIKDNGEIESKSYYITKILEAINFWNGLSEGEERHG